MDQVKPPKYLQSLPVFRAAEAETPLFACGNPFLDDPLCKLNLRETSDFVRAFPAASVSALRRRENDRDRGRESSTARSRVEDATPSTPGRPVFNFSSAGNLTTRRSVPSKWDDADKWIICSSSCRASPAHPPKPKAAPPIILDGKDSLLKDKFTDKVERILAAAAAAGAPQCRDVGTEMAPQCRDAGTEMTPLGSSTTTRCHTPLKVPSPARHNTPADRSGPFPAAPPKPGADISEIKDFHFASLPAAWTSREEEEEDVSKSLRHFEMMGPGRRSLVESRAAAWEDEERTKICVRYQREEAKIQAWVNLQTAKVEAESRKLEVKIQKMRSKLEEKLMRKMAAAARKAEEWRAAAQVQHAQETMKAAEQAQRVKYLHGGEVSLAGHRSCGCIPIHPPQHPVHHRI